MLYVDWVVVGQSGKTFHGANEGFPFFKHSLNQFRDVFILLCSLQWSHIPFFDCFLYFRWYSCLPLVLTAASRSLWALWSNTATVPKPSMLDSYMSG